jgi:hypothetical protein
VLLLHCGHRDRIRLIGQRSCGPLIPCGQHGRVVADPQVQRQSRAQHGQRYRQQ